MPWNILQIEFMRCISLPALEITNTTGNIADVLVFRKTEKCGLRKSSVTTTNAYQTHFRSASVADLTNRRCGSETVTTLPVSSLVNLICDLIYQDKKNA